MFFEKSLKILIAEWIRFSFELFSIKWTINTKCKIIIDGRKIR